MKTRDFIVGVRGLALAAAVLSGAAGCGNNNPQPPTGVFAGPGGTGGSSNTGGGGAAGSGTGGSNAGGSSSGGAAGSSTGGTGGSNCDGPNGCFACPPKADKELLNACTTAQCAPFDDVARLPLYNNGSLPPLP